jgi:RNA polymerase sigma-70 factor, ECF subfamily
VFTAALVAPFTVAPSTVASVAAVAADSRLTLRATIGDGSPFPAALWMVEPSDKIGDGAAVAARAAPRPGSPAVGELDGIMERCATGDGRAFDELYRRGAQRIRGFLVRLSGDAALADDLTQETFVRIHRARGSFDAGAAALPWMFAIARNAFLDHTRREQVRRASRAHVSQPREAALDTQGDAVLAAREMLVVVRETLDALPMLQREAFVLIRFEGLSISEAAQILGASEAAVKVRAFRAYEALREALERETGDRHRSGA